MAETIFCLKDEENYTVKMNFSGLIMGKKILVVP